MTTKLLIDRELLRTVLDPVCSEDWIPACRELRALLAAPRQPEGDTASILLPALRQYMHNDGSGLLAGYEYERTQQIVAELRGERDTLRQQLAERDAQIAGMRAEVTPFIETHWMPVARQRDKLAGLLMDVRKGVHWQIMYERIDAALADLK